MCRLSWGEQTNVKCAYWNLNGVKSKVVGEKLLDTEFLDAIAGTDILGLAELHTNEEISVPGFKFIKQKIREKNLKGLKLQGV